MNSFSFISPEEYADSAMAQQELAKIPVRRKRCTIGLMIALVTEVLFILAFALGRSGNAAVVNMGEVLGYVAIAGTVASYVVGGGLLMALKTFLGICKWCWLLCPIFPLDLLIVLIGGGIGILALIFAPLLYVFINWIKVRKETKYLSEYLGYMNDVQEDIAAQEMAREAVEKERA